MGIAAAALAAVANADATTFPIYLENRPVVATGAGETVVAWSSNGVVQTASRNADGSFTPGSAVGRTLGSHSPLLAITHTGEQILVWQSGRALRSAVRPAGRGPWKLATVAREVLRVFPQARLVVDPAGRALLTWEGPGGDGDYPGLWESTRLPGGTWSPPSRPAGSAGVGSLSMAMDSTGDVTIVYWAPADSGGPVSVRAITLPFGATDWSPPVVISEPDPWGRIEVVGGGGRTFVASWRAANPGARERSEPESVTRTARLRLPNGWETPRTLMPAALAGTPGAYGVLATHAVDAHGNALAILRWESGAGGTALAALRLPASADAWTPPVTLDVPEGREINSPPALTLAQDGSATVAILHIGLAGNTLRLATTPGESDAWQGAHTDAADIPSCPASRQPWSDVQCPIWMETTPVVEPSGPVSTVVIQELDLGASVVVLSRLGPDASWSGPLPLTSVGRTQATLRATTAGRGAVEIVATCTVPPCRGVAVLRMRDRRARILGSARFSIAEAGSAYHRILLPRWFRNRLAHGGRLWTRLSFGVHEGDGTSEQTRLPFLLAGRARVQIITGIHPRG